MKLRDKNINTIAHWNRRYAGKKNCNRNIVVETDRYFSFGLIPKDKEVSVLDVGCGYAYHFDALSEKYPLVSWNGTDLSSLAIQMNKKEFEKWNFWQEDLSKSKDPFPVVVDYVVSSHTFEHLEDPFLAFEKCKKAARKKFILCVPYGDHKNFDHEHLYRFDLDGPLKGYVDHIFIKDATFTHIVPHEEAIKNEAMIKEIFYIFDGEAE